MTIGPVLVIAVIGAFYAFQRLRIVRGRCPESERRDVRIAKEKCVYITLLFLFTIFSLVSSTILQTWVYDNRLGDEEEYLVADYTIKRNDPVRQSYSVYAAFCFALYCTGNHNQSQLFSITLYPLFIKQAVIDGTRPTYQCFRCARHIVVLAEEQ
jgi:hypothetical protein